MPVFRPILIYAVTLVRGGVWGQGTFCGRLNFKKVNAKLKWCTESWETEDQVLHLWENNYLRMEEIVEFACGSLIDCN